MLHSHKGIIAAAVAAMVVFGAGARAADPGVNRHVKAVRDAVSAAIAKALEAKTAKGCVPSAKSFVVTVESLEGWKRCDNETWGRHLVEIRAIKEGCDASDLLPAIRSALKKAPVELAEKEGGLSGHAYTVDRNKSIALKTQKEFNAKKKCKEFLIEGAGRSRAEKKVVPVYADLEVESIETEIMTKNKTIGRGETVVVHVAGSFNSEVYKDAVVLVPELMDFAREKRRDASIKNVVEVENAKIAKKDGAYHASVPVKKKFEFDVEIKTSPEFDLSRGLSLHLGMLIGGKKYPPLQLPLDLEKEFPYYLIFVAAGCAVLAAVGLFFFLRSRGIRHAKYRFALRVTAGAPAAEYELAAPSVVAGRMAPDSGGIAIASQKMSRRHVVFTRTSKGYSVSDSNSTNGTYVNGAKLAAGETRALSNGDEVRLGDVRLIFSMAKK